MSHVTLIRPAFSSIYKVFKETKKTKLILPPTGLLYIAAYLKKKGVGVEIIDNEAEQLTVEQIVARVSRNKSFMVGFGPTTPEFLNCVDLSKEIQKALPEIKVCFGGPHASALADETMQNYGGIDYIVRKEGEETTIDLIKVLLDDGDLRGVQGLSFRDQGRKVTHNTDRPLQDDINIFPWPARELLDPKLYNYSVPKKGMRPMVSIITGRGCPFSCSYCYKTFGKNVRYRDPMDVVDEIEFSINEYGSEYIVFLDETFTFNKKRVFTICDELIKRGLNHIPWFCMTRANLVSDDIILKMKSAGCEMVTLGIESGNAEMLERNGKQIKLEDYENATKTIRKHGLEARGSFIIGFPYENEKTFRETVNFAKKLKIDRANFNIMTPLPGTEIYDKSIKREGIELLTRDWSQYMRHGNAIIKTPELSTSRLKQMQEEALTEFYLQPRIIVNHIKHYISGERDLFYYRPLLFALGKKVKKLSLFRGVFNASNGILHSHVNSHNVKNKVSKNQLRSDVQSNTVKNKVSKN